MLVHVVINQSITTMMMLGVDVAGEAERHGGQLQLHGGGAEGGLPLRQEVAPQKEASGGPRTPRKIRWAPHSLKNQMGPGLLEKSVGPPHSLKNQMGPRTL